jgi:predicted RNase H-like HicB family nuclease
VGFHSGLSYRARMTFKVEIEREEDGRWIAEVEELPGVLVYGDSVQQAQAKAQALALRVLADRLDNGEAPPFESVLFAAA